MLELKKEKEKYTLNKVLYSKKFLKVFVFVILTCLKYNIIEY